MVGDRDDHIVISVEVFGVEFLSRVDDLAATLVTILLLDLQELFADELCTQFLVSEEGLQALDLLHQGSVLFLQLLTLQTSEGTQTHIHDGTRLDEREGEALHKLLDSFLRLTGRTDDADDLVDIVDSDDQALEDVDTLLGLAQLKLRTAVDDIVTVLDEELDEVTKVQQLRAALHERNIIDAEGALQRTHLVELVQHYA